MHESPELNEHSVAFIDVHRLELYVTATLLKEASLLFQKLVDLHAWNY